MKCLTKILFLIAILGCSATKKIPIVKVEGKFIWTSIYGGGETIEIKSDSTFNFSWTQGLMNGETSGIIKDKLTHLCLESQFKPQDFKFDLEIPPQTKQDYYEIMVGDDEWHRFIGATCEAYLNGEFIQGQSTDEMGICKIDSLNIDSVVIRYVGYLNAELIIENNRTPKSLIVRLKEENHYHYFEEETIRIINRNTIELETFGSKKRFKRIKIKT